MGAKRKNVVVNPKTDEERTGLMLLKIQEMVIDLKNLKREAAYNGYLIVRLAKFSRMTLEQFAELTEEAAQYADEHGQLDEVIQMVLCPDDIPDDMDDDLKEQLRAMMEVSNASIN